MANKRAIRCFKISVLMCLICPTILWGQQKQNKTYNPQLDSTWSRSTYISGMTPDGNWGWLNEVFDHKENLLHLTHTSKPLKFDFKGGESVKFSKDLQWFGCISSGTTLEVLNLNNFKRYSIANIQSYAFSDTGQSLAALQNSQHTLLIKNLKTGTIDSLKNVTEYAWHPKKDLMVMNVAFENYSKLMLYDVSNSIMQIVKVSEHGNFNDLNWSLLGNSIVFFEQSNSSTSKNTIYRYTLDDNIKNLDNLQLETAFFGYNISPKKIVVSENGKSIFFYRTPIKDISYQQNKTTVEIWNTEDPFIYPKMKDYREQEINQLLTLWQPETNNLMAIETIELPTASADINHQSALVFNKSQYEPLYKEYPNTDLYIKDMQSGEQELIIKNQFTGSGFLTISPEGRYIAYFKKHHWWVYDNENKTTLNITKDIHSNFEDQEFDDAGDTPPYGHPGWSQDEKRLVLYDRYDVWLVSPDGEYKKRITTGLEKKVKNRISTKYMRNHLHFLSGHRDFSCAHFNLKKGLLIEMEDKQRAITGFSIWTKNKLTEIAFESKKLDDILISDDFDNVIYRMQKFDAPPSIHFNEITSRKKTVLYQSNPSFKEYDVGHAELISYRDRNDDTTKAALLYPSNFDPNKKYPMIVYVYEKLAGRINVFNPPSYYEKLGFSALKYTTNGYFVLFPNIVYALQDPGISALHGVTAAVDRALETGHIQPEKIGLIGHSFGGYETAFMVTQSNRFAAAVSGSAVMDLVSHYHSIGFNWNQPEMWRYENQQNRMGDSFYNIKDAYYKNSPLHHVENINTPLLIWTGKKDLQIYWTQSIEMYLALRRLNKKGKLLLYDNEKHFLDNEFNKQHLSKSIMEWFDTFCK